VQDLAQPGHCLGLVIGLGWLGRTQSMWAELGQPKKTKKKIESVEIIILHVLEKMYFCQFIH
jgi:hypothetical protein